MGESSTKSKNRKVAWIVTVVALVVLSVPMLNWLVGLPASPLETWTPDDVETEAAARVIAAKCVHCHTSQPELPYYGRAPIASKMIGEDIREGSRSVDYLTGLTQPDGTAPSEILLAKTEWILEQNSMPPKRFLLLHWDLALTDDDRATLTRWIHSVRAAAYATDATPADLRTAAIRPVTEPVGLDPLKVELGRQLFHDTRLSSDDTISCASCHDLAKGGTDQVQFSTGVGGALGGINSPTVFNSADSVRQFWDGRADTLEAQADGPVNNPIEMASNWEEVTGKLERDRSFTEAFTAVYPDGYQMANFVDAIAEFERTLDTPDSNFDRYLKGDEMALNDRQKQGWAAFQNRGCVTCHAGEAMGGGSFEIMGLRADYFADRGDVNENDNGRLNATGLETDRHRFKVPTLRNVALTWPYFHDGSTSDLNEAVQTMARYQRGEQLTDDEAGAIVAYLESLTGKYAGMRLQ